MAEFRPPSVSPSLRDAASRWRTTLASRKVRRLALWEEDREAFTAALLAAWSLKLEVVLPGNALSGTLEALEADVDAFVGTLPDALRPSSTPTPFELTFSPHACSLVLFTSGSTGQPVAVRKSLAHLLAEVSALEATFGASISGWAQVACTVSHQHLYGLLFSVLWPLATGRGVTSPLLATPEVLEGALVGREATVLVTVPAHLKRLPPGARWNTRLAAVFSSGGPLSEEAARACEVVLGREAIEVYGSSETGGIAWRTRGQPTWVPLPGVHWRVGDEGRLEVKSPFLPQEDWFAVNDLVEPTDGSFRIVGRADRVAKLEEKRVSLGAIEEALGRSGLCVDARAMLVQGHRAEVGAVCVLTPAARERPRKAVIEALRAALEGHIDRVAWPRRFRFVDALPRDAQGKVSHPLLERLFRPTRPDVEWLEQGPRRVLGRFTVSSTLQVLEGHFPGQPVVPGVAQVGWALSFGEERFGLAPALERMEAVKFQTLMRPGQVVTMELRWDDGVLRFSFEGAGRRYSTGRLVLRSA